MSRTLETLRPGESGRIGRIAGSGVLKRRIVDMGLVPGTRVRVQKLAPLGDPIEIKVRNFNLSLRRAEAARIELDEAGGTAE